MRERMKKVSERIKQLKREGASSAEIMYQQGVLAEMKKAVGGLCKRLGCMGKVHAYGVCKKHYRGF